jgi:hypothetical protein
MVFSRFLSTTIFIPAENTQDSERPGQNPALATRINNNTAVPTG